MAMRMRVATFVLVVVRPSRALVPVAVILVRWVPMRSMVSPISVATPISMPILVSVLVPVPFSLSVVVSITAVGPLGAVVMVPMFLLSPVLFSMSASLAFRFLCGESLFEIIQAVHCF